MSMRVDLSVNNSIVRIKPSEIIKKTLEVCPLKKVSDTHVSIEESDEISSSEPSMSEMAENVRENQIEVLQNET